MRSKIVPLLFGAAFLLVAAPMALAKPMEHNFSGEVSHMDSAAKTLTVKEHGGKTGHDMTFTMAPAAKIMQGSKARSLTELEVGERVKVTYSDLGSVHQAQRIEVLAAKTANAKPASKPKSSY